MVKFFDSAIGKIVKTSLYIGVAAGLSELVTNLQNQPELFGVYWPVFNLALVAARQLLDKKTPNLPR